MAPTAESEASMSMMNSWEGFGEWRTGAEVNALLRQSKDLSVLPQMNWYLDEVRP